jgi:hypothetical protein
LQLDDGVERQPSGNRLKGLPASAALHDAEAAKEMCFAGRAAIMFRSRDQLHQRGTLDSLKRRLAHLAFRGILWGFVVHFYTP